MTGLYNEVMRRSTVRFLVASQLCLYAGLLVCIIMRPLGLTHNSGVSYYGIFADTVVPYTIALLGAAGLGLLAAAALTDPRYKYVRWAMAAIAVLLVGVAITPYSISTTFDYIHTTFGTLLFCVQLGVTGWLTFWQLRSRLTVGLWLFELVAGLISAYYVAPPEGYLLEAQMAFQLAFAILFIYCLQRLLPVDESPKTAHAASVEASQK